MIILEQHHQVPQIPVNIFDDTIMRTSLVR